MPLSISDKDFKRLYQFIQSNYGINLSQKQQLLLFTCQKRESEALAGVPGVTRLEL